MTPSQGDGHVDDEIVRSSGARQRTPRRDEVTVTPSESEVLAYFESLSNWGRWGVDDELGTLNLITPGKRVRAAQLVQSGLVVSCAHDVDTDIHQGQPLGPVQRQMVSTGAREVGDPDDEDPNWGRGDWGPMEYLGMVFHGPMITHLDALCHNPWNGRLFNGALASSVTVKYGATVNAVSALKDGIVTRGVLIDIPRLLGGRPLAPGIGVFPQMLEAAERAQRVTIEPGDAVLLRTGYTLADSDLSLGQPGWHAATLPWLHQRGVALIGADTSQDVVPSGYVTPKMPVHAVGIAAMGLSLLDNCELEAVAAACEHHGRWEFQFVVAPLRIQGGTGSPVNPMAIF